MNTNTNMGNTVYWHKNQVIVRLKSQRQRSMSEEHLINPPIEVVSQKLRDAFKSLKQRNILKEDVQFIEALEHCTLVSTTASIDNVDGALFCRINSSTRTGMGSMQGNGGIAGMGDDDRTLAVIEQLDYGKALQEILQQDEGLRRAGFSIECVDAIPHWFKAGTDGNIPTQGCPLSPPIPVKESGAAGRWKLQFSQLPDALENATGKGVKVLVLDTLPKPDQILKAAHQAGSNNMLLQEMTNDMRDEKPFDAVPPSINVNYQSVPDIILEGDPPKRVVTGKDIYGRHAGFHMADHGLFIAGIVRDLAPEATIECIRVLNDDGVGDLNTLIKALKDIHKRMLGVNPDTKKEGDLYNKPVVINLSLVVLPPEDDIPIPKQMVEAILKPSRDLLSSLLQCLADQGAIFVASAGNDSDPRMDTSEKRFGPRYPAALADQLTVMIPVGAVNRNGDAARYSNYPGPHGIATYGGDIPKPDPWLPSAMDHVVAHVDTTDPIDALCGVYTAAKYPALSMNDPEPEYAAPYSKAWAHWSGTSFATPIISALAARVLQGRDPKSTNVRQVILDAAMDEVIWTEVGEEGRDIPEPMIMAVQVHHRRRQPG